MLRLKGVGCALDDLPPLKMYEPFRGDFGLGRLKLRVLGHQITPRALKRFSGEIPRLSFSDLRQNLIQSSKSRLPLSQKWMPWMLLLQVPNLLQYKPAINQ